MILIKAGGGSTINWDAIAIDICALVKQEQVVLIHGASVRRDEIARRMGHPTRTVVSPSGISSVYTDRESIDIFLMAYAGLANKRIVATMHRHGVNAVGLSGIDGALWRAQAKKDLYAVQDGKTKLLRDNLTGRVDEVNAQLLRLLLNSHYTPVLCPPALSHDHEIVNTDNDWAAAIVAGALGVTRMVSLFEAPGMLRDARDESSVMKTVTDLGSVLPFAKGRMKKKVMGAQKARELGVRNIYWGDGRIDHPVMSALAGNGTVIY